MDLSSSSSSSSSSDDLEDIMHMLPNIRSVRDRNDLYNKYNEDEFKERYRLSKKTVLILLERFHEHLGYRTERNNPVSPLTQILITLRYYATGCFQQVIGDLVEIHKSTVCRIVHRVGHHIALLREEYITMPKNPRDVTMAKQGFYAVANFPGVIGAIDCTHIRINSPGGENSELYRNRKGWFSMNVQIVCDSKLCIMDVVARWPGSVHDSTIYNSSLLRAQFEAGEYPNCYLLGDSGYTCTNFLLTPLSQTNSEAEERYQNAHIKTRNVIERLNGVLKRRFPVLATGMQIDLNNVGRVIVATSVT
ncbi:putative nuclease HARBI1 [Diabrotica virgifera virgifera]|uniref:Putative nuclease HARBI1 n=1 Tax=Diabrotica virgifera virgifera TaxID=50390 RepID=A0ABM5K7T5_DIAVI|nr:putative nuclease HARBI1 [Diabrotica virgifera virgifera]